MDQAHERVADMGALGGLVEFCCQQQNSTYVPILNLWPTARSRLSFKARHEEIGHIIFTGIEASSAAFCRRARPHLLGVELKS